MFLKRIKGRRSESIRLGSKKRGPFPGGHSSLNETNQTKRRFIMSSKGRRPMIKSKNNKNDLKTSGKNNFNRIYTPQMNMRRDHRGIEKNSSKTKTMATSEFDFKNSVEPVNVSSIKESNMSTN